jgi:hypothetical protein
MKIATDTKPLSDQEAGYSQKQRSKRYTVKLMSSVSSNGSRYAGFILNVSDEGVAFETYDLAQTLKELVLKKIIKLNVKIPSGEILSLNCEIIWLSRHSPMRLVQNYTTHKTGMRIIDPPLKYREYVKTLQ